MDLVHYNDHNTYMIFNTVLFWHYGQYKTCVGPILHLQGITCTEKVIYKTGMYIMKESGVDFILILKLILCVLWFDFFWFIKT